MSRRLACSVIAVVLLAATGLLLAVPVDVTSRPLPLPLELMPLALADWRGADGPVEELAPDPQAASQLIRTYRSGADTVWVAVGYYPSQTEGQRPRAQALLFPRSGWSTLEAHPARLGIRPSGLDVTVVLLQTGRGRVAIAYWYHTAGRPVASDHWYRASVLYNRVVRGRADGALVRVAVPLPEGDVPAAVARLSPFVQAFYPELLRALPE